jgi:hypothetical protein
LNLDLQLEGEFYDLPSFRAVVVPDPGIRPNGQDVPFLGQRLIPPVCAQEKIRDLDRRYGWTILIVKLSFAR